MAFPGNGYKIANDVLTEISYVLVEPVVDTTLGTAVAAPGVATVTPPTMASIYAGALLIVGTGTTQEVITVNSVTPTTLTATFVYAHTPTEQLIGATFPVGEDNNPFFTQSEMLQYLADAENDYLTACPVILNVVTQNFGPAQRVQSVPADCLQLERIATGGYALYEQGQTSLDWLAPTWQQATPSAPTSWFEDRVNFMTYGVEPVPLNSFAVQVIYAQRDSEPLALNEGFLLPDPFLTYVKYDVLAQCFGKDGEMRDPARARYCEQRVGLGVKIGRKFYENAIAQGVTENAG